MTFVYMKIIVNRCVVYSVLRPIEAQMKKVPWLEVSFENPCSLFSRTPGF